MVLLMVPTYHQLKGQVKDALLQCQIIIIEKTIHSIIIQIIWDAKKNIRMLKLDNLEEFMMGFNSKLSNYTRTIIEIIIYSIIIQIICDAKNVFQNVRAKQLGGDHDGVQFKTFKLYKELRTQQFFQEPKIIVQGMKMTLYFIVIVLISYVLIYK